MTNPKTWVVAVGEEMVGRLGVDQIAVRREKGEIDNTAVAWEPGSDEWVPIHAIAELAHLFPAPLEDEPSIPHWTPTSLGHIDPEPPPAQADEPAGPTLPNDLPAIKPRVQKRRDSLLFPPSLPWHASDLSRPWVRPGIAVVGVAALVLLGFQLFTQSVAPPVVEPTRDMQDLTIDLVPVAPTEGDSANERRGTTAESATTSESQAQPASGASSSSTSNPVAQRARSGAVTDGSAEVAATAFDASAIVKGVRAHSRDLRACLGKAHADGQLAAGFVVLVWSWTITADGSVRAPEVKGPNRVMASSVPSCLAARMTFWKFTPPPGREVAVKNFQAKLPVP